jgi:cytochrome c oxidase cbb3-type subunit I/II
MLYEAERGDISIAVVGDAMLSRRLRPYREPDFLKLAELLRNTDLSIANLEFLFHDFEHAWQWTRGTYTRSDPKNLGELKWMATRATDYTPTEQLGRGVYVREGCWYCHSQYVRPVTGETRRWGPVSEAGEYAYDVPHLFGTRRIGPDLTRVGLKYSNEWHLAHFWNPRELLPDSIMAPYRALFDTPRDPVKIVDDGAGNRTLENNAITQKLFDFESKVQIKLTPNAAGLLFVPLEARDKAPAILIPNIEYIGNTVTIAAETK